MGKYPRVGHKTTNRPAKGLCNICGEPQSDYRVDIEVNWFRGDDVVVKLHRACLDEALTLGNRATLADDLLDAYRMTREVLKDTPS